MPLNYYTDEILDSMLSLRRFTSLVQWQCVEAADGSTFRPLRRGDPAEDEYQPIILYKSTKQVYADDGWLWTGASDGTITIGWIVREYAFAGPQWSYEPNTEAPPWMRIDGLASGVDLELTWFDDRRGIVIGKNGPFQGPATGAQVPGTEENGCFGKSVAFVIQPVGMTPEKHFAELPNELIGQISIVELEGTGDWHEETPIVHDYQHPAEYTFIARTRPEIPEAERSNYSYYWNFGYYVYGSPSTEGYSVSGVKFWRPGGVAGVFSEVTVEIEDARGVRVCGDAVHVQITP